MSKKAAKIKQSLHKIIYQRKKDLPVLFFEILLNIIDNDLKIKF